MQERSITHRAYLEIVPVVLVILTSVYAAIALFRRAVDELVLGIGGLIFGLWGANSGHMPRARRTLLAMDRALLWAISVFWRASVRPKS
jgi:membrane associated rhomboid family serine protease